MGDRNPPMKSPLACQPTLLRSPCQNWCSSFAYKLCLFTNGRERVICKYLLSYVFFPPNSICAIGCSSGRVHFLQKSILWTVGTLDWGAITSSGWSGPHQSTCSPSPAPGWFLYGFMGVEGVQKELPKINYNHPESPVTPVSGYIVC